MIALLYYQAQKVYLRHVRGKINVTPSLNGHTFIITGSNTGIGYETAKALLEMQARVILACRSTPRANEAKQKLLSETKATESDVRNTSKLSFLCIDYLLIRLLSFSWICAA